MRSSVAVAVIVAAALVGTAASHLGGSSVRVEAEATPLPIIELRQYTLHPGRREELIDLFETEFIESQEAVGMQIVGQFRDLDKPDRFVWIRGFKDMSSRAEGLEAFYDGALWQAHRSAANATIADSDNVLLLRAARPGSGFSPDDRLRPPRGARETPQGLIVANICYFDAPVEAASVDFFENVVRPHLNATGIPILASLITETSPNNYPRLPIREHEHVFVWFARFADRADYEQHLATPGASWAWNGIAETLHQKMKGPPEVLLLQPTPRSQMHD
jgi:quinol monooxygenase YgiN